MIRRVAVAIALSAALETAHGQQAAAPAPGRAAGAQRQLLERQVRQALARRAQQELGLDDAGMANLARVDQKFEQQRRVINREETQTRQMLRKAVLDSAPEQATIAQGMDQLIAIQRRRVDLLEAEQKDLAAFLTPLQRVKYHALQERVRRAVEQRLNGGGGRGRGRAGAPPPAE